MNYFYFLDLKTKDGVESRHLKTDNYKHNYLKMSFKVLKKLHFQRMTRDARKINKL